MRLLTAIALSTALLAGCSPMQGVEATGAPPAQSQTAEAAACSARNGMMQPVGRMQTMQCVVRYANAGKRCTTGSDCQGDCRVEDAPFPTAGAEAVGRCQADSQPFGCHASVEGGKATAAICID